MRELVGMVNKMCLLIPLICYCLPLSELQNTTPRTNTRTNNTSHEFSTFLYLSMGGC
jgi:hypothetical protein